MAEQIPAIRFPTITLEFATVNNFDILCSGSLANIKTLTVHTHGIGQTASRQTDYTRATWRGGFSERVHSQTTDHSLATEQTGAPEGALPLMCLN